MLADAAWVWEGYRKKTGEQLHQNHPPNQLLGPLGIVWTRGMVSRDAGVGATVQKQLNPTLHALKAIKSVARGNFNDDRDRQQARVVIEQIFEAVPSTDKHLLPQLKQLAQSVDGTKLKADLTSRRGVKDLKRRLAIGFQTIVASRQSPADAVAVPLANHFPGRVDQDAPRLTKTCSIDTKRPRWHFTGLYAAPGEAVTATFPQSAVDKGLQLRIGAHKDRLWHKASWKRAPEVTRQFPVRETSIQAANSFGGLIYIEVPKACELGELQIRISNAVESPRYEHGQTTLQDWANEQSKPGPWAEIGSGKIVFTVPSSKLRRLGRPDLVMEYWDEVMDACADLATIDHQRESPERFVIDVQISAGYMHAGYPIMAPSNLADEVLDVETLRQKGNWGVFHEIGHNHQEKDWTYQGMGEVTVNLFSMYVYDSLHPGAKQHGQVEPDRINQMIQQFEKTGRRDGPWVNLIPYIQLKREFGWDSFKEVFAEYRSLEKSQRPKSDLEKRSQWLIRFSNQVERNLTPLFDYWKNRSFA